MKIFTKFEYDTTIRYLIASLLMIHYVILRPIDLGQYIAGHIMVNRSTKLEAIRLSVLQL